MPENKNRPKKSSSSKLFWGIFLISNLLLLSNCEIGLGGQVDVNPPSIAVTEPAPGAYIRGNQVFRGVASDDMGVTAMQISFDSGVTWESIPQDNLSGQPKNINWSFTKDTNALGDGPVSILVLAQDAAGRATRTEPLVFRIDNTAPVVLVKSPFDVSQRTQPENTQISIVVESEDVHPIVSYGIMAWGAIPPTTSDVLDYNSLEWTELDGYPKTSSQGGSPWTYVFESNGFTEPLTQLQDSFGNPLPPRMYFKYAVWATDAAGNRSQTFYHIDDIMDISGNVSLSAIDISSILKGNSRSIGQTTLTSQILSNRAISTTTGGLIIEFDEDADIPRIALRYPTQSQGSTAWPTMPSSADIQLSLQDDDGIELETISLTIDRVNQAGDYISDGIPNEQNGSWIWQNIVDSWVPTAENLNLEDGRKLLTVRVPVTDLISDSNLRIGRYRLTVSATDIQGTSSREFTRYFIISDGLPVVTVEAPDSVYISNRIVLEGTVNHPIPLDSVEILIGHGSNASPIWVYGQDESIEADYNPTDSTWTFDSGDFSLELNGLTALPNGNILVEVRGVIGPDVGEGKQNLIRDTQAPAVHITSPEENSPINQNARIQGTSNDSLAGIEGLWFLLSHENDPKDPDSIPHDEWWEFSTETGAPTLDLDGYQFSGTPVNFTFHFDSEVFDDGVIKVYVKARDRAGNTSIESRDFEIDQESNRPVLGFTNVLENETDISQNPGVQPANLFLSLNSSITGTVNDDDGVAGSAIQQRTRMWNSSENTWGSWSEFATVSNPYTGTRVSGNFGHSLSAYTNGIYQIEFRVGDIGFTGSYDSTNYNWNSETIGFAISTAAPAVSITSLQSGAFVSGGVVISGNATDANGIHSVQIQIDGSTESASLTGNTWTYTLNPAGNGDDDGPKTIRVLGTDRLGQTTEANVDIIIDTQSPTNPVIDVLGTPYVENLFTLGGTASDTGSGVGRIEYALNSPVNGWTQLDTRANWSGPIDVGPSGFDLSEGSHELFVRVVDKAGNISGNTTMDFVIDRNNPAVIIDSIDSIDFTSWLSSSSRNSDFEVSGTASDANGIQSLSISLDNGGSFTPLLDSPPAGGSTDGSPIPWTQTVSVPPGGGSDGLKTVVIRGIDTSGRISDRSFPVRFDTTSPELNVVNLTNGAAITESNFTINGTASDVSGIASIEYSLNNGPDWNSWTTVNNPNTNWNHQITGLIEGNVQEIRFRAIDTAGNIRTTDVIQFGLDLNPPQLEISEIDGTTFLAWIANTSKRLDFDISGTTSDANGIKTLEISLDAGSSYNPMTNSPAPGSSIDSTILNWTQTIIVPPNGLEDGIKTIRIRATDNYNKTTEVSIGVRFDTLAPILGVNNLVDGQLITTGSYTVQGTWTDQGGSGTTGGTAQIEYRIGSGEWASVGTPSASSWSQVLNLDQGLNQTIEFRATDRVGNVSSPVSLSGIDVDTALPVLTETTVATTDLVLRNNGITLGGTASDTLGLASVTINATRNGVDQGEIFSTGTSPWVYSLVPEGNDGLWVFTLTATDVAGRSSGLTRTARLDNTPGSALITSPGMGELVGGTTYTFSGTASDGGSGVKAVQVAFAADGTGAITAAGTSSWSANITLATALGTEGPKTLFVRVEDNAGNWSSWTSTQRDFVYDTAAPILIQDGPLSRNVNSGFSLTGTASDNYGLAGVGSWIITQQKDGGPVIPIGENLPTITGTSQNPSWNLLNLPRDPADIGSQILEDGEYVYSVTALDLAGRSSDVLNLTVRLDQTPPETLTISNPEPGSTGLDSLSGGAYTFRGTAADSGVGIARVHYIISDDPTPPSGLIGYTSLITSGNWSFTDDFDTDGSGPDTGREEGTWYLHLKAEDTAGNVTSDPNTQTRMFMIDQANPTVVETHIGLASLQNRNNLFSLGGTATDTHGIMSIVLTQSKDGAPSVILDTNGPVLGGTVNNRTWNLTDLPRNPGDIGSSVVLDGSSDGIYEYEIFVTDLAGKITSIKRTLRLDTQSPVLVITSPVENEGVDTATYTLRGTVTDNNGIGVSGLAYSLNSSNGSDGDWTPITPSFSWQVPGLDFSTGGQGPKSVWVRSSDGLNPVVSQQVSFYFDTDNPVLTETGVNTDLIRYSNSVLTFGGTASDTNALDRLELRVNGGVPSQIPVVLDNWTYDHPVDTQGDFTLVFTAVDVAGRIASLTRRVFIDTTLPTVTLTTDTDGWRSNPNLSMNGTAGDGGSGVEAVEYSLNGGTTWALFTGTTIWSGNLGFDAGVNSLQIRSRDRAGNLSPTITRSIQIDTTAPTATLTAPTGIPKINGSGDVAVTLSAADTANMVENGSGVSSVLLKVNNNDFSSGTISGNLSSGSVHSGIWTLTVPGAQLAALDDGQRNIFIRVRDGVNLDTFLGFPVFIDKTPPSLSLTSHGEGQTVNRVIVVSGTASDSQGLDPGAPVTAEIWNSTLAEWEAITPVNGSFNWSFFLDTQVYDNSGYDIGGDPGVQIRIRITARDEAGNISQVVRELNVDQNSDRPIISLTNIDVDGLSTLKLTRTIYGTVTDDDGTLNQFQVSLNGTDWTTRLVSGGSWTFEIPAGVGDGELALYFRVTDNSGTVFTTTNPSTLLRPRVFVDETPSYSDNPVTFRLDTVTPEIDSTIFVDRLSPLDFSDPETVTTNMPFGGLSSEFRIRILARDANGIDSVTVTVPGAPGSPYAAVVNGTQGGFDRFETGVIDISSVPDGSMDLMVTVLDNSGLQSTASRTILVDNSPPTHQFLSPIPGDIVNGSVTIRGLSSDGGSGLASVEYKLGYNHSTQTWQSVSGSLFNWEIPLTGINNINNYAGRSVVLDPGSNVFTLNNHGFQNGEQAWIGAIEVPGGLDPAVPYYVINATSNTFQLSGTEGGPAIDGTTPGSDVRVSNSSTDLNNDGVWILPVLLRIRDVAGNIVETTPSDYQVQIDPSGDIPKIFIVYPEPAESNRTLGGSIRIFGSAEDDDAVDSVWMQITEDGGASFGPYTADNGMDWWNGGEGRLVNGTVSWNQTINADGEFNPPGEGIRTIYFRVRARDIFGTYSPWSAPQRIDVDKNAPVIGDLILEKGLAQQLYVSDTWLKGDWNITGTVQDESGIAEITLSGDITGSLSSNPEWFTITETIGGYYNYSFNIPVTNDAANGLINFTILALDASTPQLQTSVNVRVQADNSPPTGNPYTGATPIIQSNLAYTLSSSFTESGSGFGRVGFYFIRRDRDGITANDRVYMPMVNNSATPLTDLTIIDGLYHLVRTGASRPDPYTLMDPGIIGNPNVRVGGIVRIGGLDRRILSVDSGIGSLSWADEVSTDISDYSVAYAMIVDNQNNNEIPVYSGSSLVSITNDDGDGMVESVERLGSLYNWTASINSKNLPDGPIEIHWVSYDRAGNYSVQTRETSIANNRPRLAAVILGTDLDGTGTVDANEKVPPFSTLDGFGNEQSVVTLSSESFVARGLTTMELDVVGGNGQLQYILTHNGDELFGGLQNLRTDGVSPILPITLGEANLTSVGEGDRTFVITIWDSTEETVPGTDSLNAELTVPMVINQVDIVPPRAVIQPFYWNSATDNSLYDNSRNNGHIELPDDLPLSIYNQGNELYDSDPKVSGQISIRGTAYDDQRITSLWMAIDGFGFTGAGAANNQFDTNGDGFPEILGQTYYRLATFDAGVWSDSDEWESQGWRFSVTPVYLNQDGHLIEWQLDWDSSRVAGVASLDRVIRILAQDRRNTPQANASSEITQVDSDVSLNNQPSLRIDVVPYITRLQTPNRNASGLKDNNIRSSTGRYSIIQGNVNDFILVSGFNLNPNGVRLVDEVDVTSPIDVTSGVGLAYSGVSANYRNFSLSNNSAVSGYLEIFTNSIRSLNNINENDSKGSYINDIPENLYNREPDRFVTRNILLNDDRYLRFFRVIDTGVRNGYYPTMILDGDNPVFSYVDLTGGPATGVGLAPGTGAGSYQASHAMPQRAQFNGITGAEITTEYLIKASIWDQMGMARDDGGRYHHLTVYNRDNASMSYLYDRYAELYGNGEGWGTGTSYQGYGGNRSENINNNAITLEGLNFGNGLMLGRYQYPRIIARGNSVTEHAKVYMLYYDDNTTNRELIFRNFRVGVDVTGGGTAPLFAGGTSTTGQAYEQRANLADSNTTGRNTAATSASRHFDFAVTSDFRVIVLFYDEAAGRMRLRYSTNPVDGSTPLNAVAWTESPIVFPEYVGNYLSMTLDSNNGIHIAAYDAADADLSYLFLPSYDGVQGDLRRITVDAAFSVGLWTQIRVQETGPTIIPYIAYVNSSETGQRDSLKLAYSLSGITIGNVPAGVDSEGFTTGNWEYLNMPSITPAQAGGLSFQRVNLDFDTQNRPVLGYLGTNLEFGRWLDE